MTAERKNIMLGTAGHVDHGKTALVKMLTGCDTDRLAAEKRRGLSIELGFAPCRMADRRIIGIVDVPGHVDFIRNMVAGAQGIDVVILVVAADDGVMPQTREHLDILTLMGVGHGLVALTKIDLVDEAMRALVAEDVRGAVAGTFLAEAPICPISNVTGEGFEGLFSALNSVCDACRQRDYGGLFRMWIERSFLIRGFGTVVSGIPTGGQVRPADHLRLLPDGLIGRIRGIEVYGERAELGRAGECVALNMVDIDHELLGRGKVLCEGEASEAVSVVEAELVLLAGVPAALKDHAEVHVHVGTTDTMAHVAMLEDGPPAPGRPELVQLRLRRALGIAPGDRFVIRASVAGLAGGRLTTIGGGTVLSTSNIRFRRNRPWTLDALRARRAALDDQTDWCALHLKEAARPLTAVELARLAAMHAQQAARALEALRADGVAVPAGEGLVHRDALAEAARRLTAALEEFHAANPMRSGMTEGDLIKQADLDGRVCAVALSKLIDGGHLVRRGAVVALAGKAARLSAEDEQLLARLEQALRGAHLEPPLPRDLAASLGLDEDRLGTLLRLLADRGLVVMLDRKVVMHAEAVAAARQTVVDLFGSRSSFETVAFRDALGVSRKYAVPLLDYFDTVGLTVRSGSRRRPGVEAKRRLESS